MSDDFPELVERTRKLENDVCETAKLVLRQLLPGVEALQKDSAHFSPRLLLLMLSRTGEKLAPDDRKRLGEILRHAESFQPQLVAWMRAVKEKPASAGSPADLQECSRALDLMSKHLSALERLLAKVGGGSGAS